ncbi:MAG: hypothetical protein ACM359_09500 [Bacillota bacterium]
MSDNNEINLTVGQPSRGRYPISLVNGTTVLETAQINPYKPEGIDAFLHRVVERCPGLADRVEEMRSQLLQLAAPSSGPSAPVEHQYQATPEGLFYLKPTVNGPVSVRLTNFVARIVGDITRDDGVFRERHLLIEAAVGGLGGSVGGCGEKPAYENASNLTEKPGLWAEWAGWAGFIHTLTLRASEFSAMNWPVEQLGADAIVYAGMGIRDHARAAIQSFGQGQRVHRVIYTHTGWRKVKEAMVYLHAGGAIGAQGKVDTVEVDVPGALAGYILPEPPQGERLIRCIQASLRLLDLGQAVLTLPAFCCIWRAPLGECDMSQYLAGPTGVFKSEFAALCQQHYGAGLSRSHLPGSWSSTDNALEALAFSAKDALFVIDDFAPRGTTQDIQRLHQKADRIFRAQGNGSGRQRLTADNTMRPTRQPRGLVFSTGEEVPLGESLRSRLLISEIGPGDIDPQNLTRCQADAREGWYAGAMSGFIQWLAGRIEAIQARLRDEVVELRVQAAHSQLHRRTPEVVANMAIGLRYFLQYARESGAITPAQGDELWARGWSALGEAAMRQFGQQSAEEPAQRFLDLLTSALASGHAHLADTDDEEPSDPARWGWRKKTIGSGLSTREEWQAQGDRIGWVDEEYIYLDPNASYRAAQGMAGSGEGVVIGAQTLRKRLDEKGLLVREAGRQELLVRHVLGRLRRRVLQMRAEHLGGKKPAQSAHDPQYSAENEDLDTVLWAGSQPPNPPNPPTRVATAKVPSAAA